MIVVIDTNSLLSLVRYYLPFDRNGVLYHFIKARIADHSIVIIDKVFEESRYISKGDILKKIDYLSDKKFLKSVSLPYKTDKLLIPNTRQFYHQLNSTFLNSPIRKKLTDVEYEHQKNSYIQSADMKQIILCLDFIQKGEKVVLVTEETESGNDHKPFKKIPSICKELQIPTMTLPELLVTYDGIELYFE
jgi:hypothetical protein